jgi:biopolymer transport protein ExbD
MSVRLNHGNEELSELHEINVTPFIDVILVLLIIFMIAAPLATVDISVDLPISNAQHQPHPDKPIFLTLKPDLSLTLNNEQTVPRNALGAILDQATGGDREQRLFLRADKTVPYGEMMQLMNDLRSAGYLKIALVGMESDTPR